MKAWKISGLIWIILFVITAIFIMVRKVDGAGVVQTTEIKLVTLGILAICAVLVAIPYIIWYIYLKRK
ncbi:DUF3923 family protein [Lactobacillus kalixensis]|uniref:DUF3923 domain-containing protein n=1 Tax=Lactobacillus kalixensis DSM 16043 TaxID=1423763 RepID=A0A0R1U315_9LACO|nr:DUF3923 family protein [Lactobacillus kalixensis]KRL87713.1 hypothetical protein FC46_GL001722 [Lactobacillus kalixensis DSM 16043]